MPKGLTFRAFDEPGKATTRVYGTPACSDGPPWMVGNRAQKGGVRVDQPLDNKHNKCRRKEMCVTHVGLCACLAHFFCRIFETDCHNLSSICRQFHVLNASGQVFQCTNFLVMFGNCAESEDPHLEIYRFSSARHIFDRFCTRTSLNDSWDLCKVNFRPKSCTALPIFNPFCPPLTHSRHLRRQKMLPTTLLAAWIKKTF